MRLSLITIYKRNDDGTVDGSLLQNKMSGSVEEAVDYAKEVKKVNGDKIDIAVVEEVGGNGYKIRLSPLAVV